MAKCLKISRIQKLLLKHTNQEYTNLENYHSIDIIGFSAWLLLHLSKDVDLLA